jgi:tRNA-guanine family transglycosylase
MELVHMRLYIGWYPGDPVYSRYDADAALLISPTSVANRWTVKDLSHQPRYLMIDSGAFRYGLLDKFPTQKQVFHRQLQMIEGSDSNVTICQLDFPLVKSNLSSNERDTLIHKSLGNAYELINRADQMGAIEIESLMGVVQGYDVDSLLYSAYELKQMGYKQFGIGSLALIYNNEKILERVRAVQTLLGQSVHVFGVTGSVIAPHFRKLGVASIDSSRPAKAAMYNVIFSSNPFKRHRIRPTRGEYWQNTYIEEPFNCDCPVCNGGKNENLLRIGKREYSFQRTLHNYYHLNITLTEKAITARTEVQAE